MTLQEQFNAIMDEVESISLQHRWFRLDKTRKELKRYNELLDRAKFIFKVMHE